MQIWEYIVRAAGVRSLDSSGEAAPLLDLATREAASGEGSHRGEPLGKTLMIAMIFG